MPNVYDRLAELGITLPPLAVPAAAYVPFVRSGNLSSSRPHRRRATASPGRQLAPNIDTATGGRPRAPLAIDLLGTLHAAVGDLNKVERIVKVMSLVNSTPTFTEQHRSPTAASELLGAVFGDKGAHARSAFGVAQIPLGACVEIELIARGGLIAMTLVPRKTFVALALLHRGGRRRAVHAVRVGHAALPPGASCSG